MSEVEGPRAGHKYAQWLLDTESLILCDRKEIISGPLARPCGLRVRAGDGIQGRGLTALVTRAVQL